MPPSRRSPVSLLAVMLLAALAPPAEAADPPNLTVTAPGLNPASPAAGDVVVFTATVGSAGADARNVTVSFYIDGAAAGNRTLPFVGADTTIAVASTPWTSTNGTHTLKVLVDQSDRINETEEGDNEVVLAFTVGAAVDRPELVPLNMTFSPSAPTPGSTVTITVNLKNSGELDTGSFNASLRVGLIGLDPFVVPNIPAGITFEMVRTWTAVNGTHNVTFQADVGGTVAEHNEHNNWKNATLGAQPKPDLVVTQLRVDPSPPVAGTTATLRVTVKNDGSVGAGAFRVAFHDGEALLGHASSTGLAPGGSVTLDLAWPATVGQHRLRAEVDADDDVKESSEDNNGRTLTITPTAPVAVADLVVQTVETSPPAPSPGQAINLTATIVNQGQANAGAFRVTFIFGGVSLGTADVASLAAGASTRATTGPWTPPSEGTHTVLAQADPDGRIPEASEANNQATVAIGVAPPAPFDGSILEVLANPPSPQPGETVTFTATTQLSGARADDRGTLVFVLDGTSLGAQTITGAAPLANLQASWVATPGRHVLLASLTVSRDELTMTNNARTLTVDVGTPPLDNGTLPTAVGPDLVPVRAGLDPADVAAQPGARVFLQGEVANEGTVDAGPFAVEFRVDGQPVGSVGLSGLAAGGRVPVRGPSWAMTPGAHTYTLVVDPQNQVAESNETNNAPSGAADAPPGSPPPAAEVPGPGIVAVAAAVVLALAVRRRR